MAEKVTLYTADWCPWCHKAEEFLRKHRVKFLVKDIENKPEYAREMVKKSRQTGIPVIEIGGEIVVGYDEPALRKALNIK